MPNCSLYKNGVQAALNAGKFNPANSAACKLKQTLAHVKSSGLGKGGYRVTRVTRRGRKATRGTRRSRK